jgi:HEAT repeat protein
MKAGRGRRIALWTAAAAVMVSVGALVSFKRPILEYYYLRMLKSGDPVDRRTAATRLGDMTVVRALPLLSSMLLHPGEQDNAARNAAADAMGRIGPHETAIPYLLPMLGDQNVPEYRRFAAWCLGEIGPRAIQTIPDLELTLEDQHEPARKAAAEALRKIRGEKPAG